MGEFPELKTDVLCQYASRWAKRYRAIKRVLLYEYPVSPVEGQGKSVPLKYAIVFDVSDAMPEEIAEVEEAIGVGQTMDYDYTVKRFVGTRFNSVYQSAASDGFLNQWDFVIEGGEERTFTAEEVGEDPPRWFPPDLPHVVLFHEGASDNFSLSDNQKEKSQSKGSKRQQKKDTLELLIEATLLGLREKLQREPSSGDVYHSLPEYDKEDIGATILEHEDDYIDWMTCRDKPRKTKRRTFENRLSKIKAKHPPSF